MRRFAMIVALAVLAGGCGGSESAGTDKAAAKPDATVTMQEFAYIVTGTMKAGGTLRLRNTGKQFHMIGAGKLKEGKTLADAKAALQTEDEADDDATLTQVGMPGGIFGPGGGADVSVPTLAPGRYAMACFINDEGKETPHFALGMIGEFEVSAATGAAAEPDATYRASKGKAITGPASLKAGRHTIKIERDSAGEGLEPGIAKLDEGVTPEQFFTAVKAFEEGPLPVDAASKLPGRLVAVMFDFRDAMSVTMTVDFTAGTYVLVSDDSDAENKPTVPVERIVITVT